MRMEQLLSILRLTPVMMGANIFIAALVLLAGFSGPHRVSLSIWACLVVSYGLLGLRGWLASRRRKSGKATVSPRGLRSIILQAGLLGCLWGALPVLAMDGASVQMRMLIVSVIAGMIGCGGFAMLTLPPAAIAYSTPMVMGSLVVLLTSRDPILMALAGLLIFCYLVVTFSSLSHARVFAERLIAGEELEHQRQMVSLLLSDFEEGASDWLWEVDASGALTYVSDRMAEAAGLAREALLGRNVASFAVQVAEAEPGLAADLTGILGERKAFRDVTLRMTVEGTDRWWSLTAKPTHDLSGTFTGFRGVGAD
ncbi:GGDEF domain-containing protein, partial [Pseudomonas sp. HMWF010]